MNKHFITMNGAQYSWPYQIYNIFFVGCNGKEWVSLRFVILLSVLRF